MVEPEKSINILSRSTKKQHKLAQMLHISQMLQSRLNNLLESLIGLPAKTVQSG